MEFMAIIDAKARAPSACAAVGIYENGDLGVAARQVDKQQEGLITRLLGSGDFAAKLGDSLMLPLPAGSAASRLLLIGLGTRAAFGRKQYRKAILAGAQALAKTGAGDAAVYLAMEPVPELDIQYRARIIAEVFASQAYKIPDMKTSPKPKARRLTTVKAASDARGAKATAEGLRMGTAIGSGLAFARDLANLPPNVCTPTYMGTRALQLAKEFSSIKTKVLDQSGIKALKMGAFLAVAQGSVQPPRLIVCEYRGARNKESAPICLVGKGITFDSGGISLKEPPAMDEMKFDMSGAAAVLGTMRAIAELKLPINVVVIVAAAENMPSGSAVKPADIVTTMSGQTVEILNTDAEGRLVLCDAITYSRRYNPAAVVDVATLTGACIVALGNHISGLMSNTPALAQELETAGIRADDRAWRLPIGEEYVDQLKSNFADIANVGGREGGACTAASFLGKFAKDLNWAHLDVAGTAWVSGAQKGSTGRPVPLLVDFLIHRAKAS
jgi:leucyl aminopeptidase